MTTSIDLERLAADWEPKMRAAFLDAIQRAANRVDIAALVRLLENGDVGGALRLVGLEPANFSGLALVHQQIFNTGGAAAAASIPPLPQAAGYALHILFDVRNPAAEAWIRQQSGTLIKEIVDDQRVTIRDYLEKGLAAGNNPRTTALDLVGRIDPRSRQRVGGVIGLHSTQEVWLRNYADKLANDPRAALDYTLRDKRFDRTILRAIQDGTPIPADIQVKARVSYANKALKYRADMIARNETVRALGAGQAQAYDQAISDGKLDVDLLIRYWVTAGDARVRPTHRLIPGMNAEGRKWNQPFQTPDGPSMHAPHDTDIGCRCYEKVHIDFIGKALKQVGGG